jgi:phytoene dehydrogenase-like protein
MADKTYDAVVIGGGSKSLVTALYLQAYGGMKTCIVEDRHELGGCLHWQDGPAPGFSWDVHATIVWDWYFLPILYDFPKFEEYGARFRYFPAVQAIMFKSSDDYLVIYHRKYDPTGELTAKELARYSKQDVETFLKLEEHYMEPGGRKDAALQQMYSLPPEPGQPDALELWTMNYVRRPDAVFDDRMMFMSANQGMRTQWEGIPLRCYLLSTIPFMHMHPDEMGGFAAVSWAVPFSREYSFVAGGTHNIAHAMVRLFVENGGEFYSKSEVDKIIIENGEARGVRLADGTEVKAKIVVSGVDPHQLCFRFIGNGHLDAKVMKKITNLERIWQAGIAGATFAVQDYPNYTAAKFNPIFEGGVHNILIWKEMDENQAALETNDLRQGIDPENPYQLFAFGVHSAIDPTRVPDGKCFVATASLGLVLHDRSEKEWLQYRRWKANQSLRTLQAVAPNMTWDNVIDYRVNSAYEMSKGKRNMPTGNENVIDCIPSQMGRFRPIPEWADHRIPPIKNLYGTGAAWGCSPGANSAQGYTCYKAIAIDHGLRKPWEEKNRPW